ncbi:TPA: hypothetical protein ACGFAK_004801 [Serratia marcescens]|uniref:hypothetical protein n=1 Tax=Serratia marcescens TaxID=615 RepID=UPI0036F9C347
MENTTQTHYGSGDNVLGGKLEYNIESANLYIGTSTVIPSDLKVPIQEIFKLVSNRKTDDARDKLKLISSITNLSDDVHSLLYLIEVRCGIIEDAKIQVDLGNLQRIITSSSDAMIKDFAISLALRASLIQEGEMEARNRLDAYSISGNYSKAVVLELFSNKQELLTIVERKYNLSEEELIGLIAGLMRVESSDEACKLAEYLNKNHTSLNSAVINFYAQAVALNPYLRDCDYWVLSQEMKDKVDELTKNIITFMNDYHGRDIRLFNIVVPLYIFTKERNILLRQLCLDNLDFVEKVHNEFSKEFKSIFTEIPFDESNKITVAKRCKNDAAYRINYVEKISDMSAVDISDFLLAKEILTSDEFHFWALKGLEIIGGHSELESNIYRLLVMLVVKNSDAISEILSRILESEEDLYETVSSITILLISDLMCDQELRYDACDVMAKYIGDRHELWCSPFVIQYLINLYSCGRYLDFHELERKTIDSDKPDFIFYQLIESYLYHYLPKSAEAVFLRVNNPKDLEFFSLKLRTLNLLGKKVEIENELNVFDYSTINSPSDSLFIFLRVLASFRRHDIIEIIAVNLFLIDPEAHSKFVSDVGNNFMIGAQSVAHTPSYNLNDCICGFQYDDFGSTFTKLIIKNIQRQGQYFLSESSIIATYLLSAAPGEQQRVGNKLITLQEKIPPYVAVYRLANTIRHESNDGSDDFQIIKLPDDPEKMLDSFKSLLPQKKERQVIEFDEGVFLSLQTSILDRSDPIKSSLRLLTQKKSKYHEFISDGSPLGDSICTDFITVVYLCLSSLSHYLINNGVKIHLIKEDIDSFHSWLNNINDASYISMDIEKDGRVLMTTPDQFKIVFKEFIKNLKALLPSLIPLELQMTNSPKEFPIIAKVATTSYLKFLYALKTTDLKFLTIDTKAALYVNARFGSFLSNTNSIFLDASREVAFSSREEGVQLHCVSEFPYALPQFDFMNLSSSSTDPHGVYISSLINKYAGYYNDEIEINTFMNSVFYNYLNKAMKPDLMGNVIILQDNTYQVNPYSFNLDKVFNACCNAIVLAKGNATGEEKLSIFILCLTYRLSSRRLREFIFQLAFNYATGHFMDIGRINNLLSTLAANLNTFILNHENE